MDEQDKQKWLEERKQYLGGTDASAIIGVNPYRTGLDVWLDKTGRAEPIDDNEKMFWGRMLEDIVAQVFSKRTGLKVKRRGTIRGPSGILGANIDRMIVGDSRGPGILECKTADLRNAHRWGDTGTDEIPEEYLCQVQHYLAVTGYTWARLAVLIGGNDFRVYDLPRDDEIIDALVKAEMRFWNDHVVTDEPPDPETLADLAKLYPRDSGREIVATAEIETAVDTLKQLKETRSAIQTAIDSEELTIKKYMTDATRLFNRGGDEIATWKAHDIKRLDSKKARAALGYEAHQYETTTVARPLRVK